MGAMIVKCNKRQLQSILRDFEDVSVPVDVFYGRFHKSITELKIYYDDQDSSIVAGIVKYRMRSNEKKD